MKQTTRTLNGVEDDAKQLANSLIKEVVGGDPFEIEWVSNPEPFDPTNLVGSGGLSAAGLNFFRLGISARIDDPEGKSEYPDERALYCDTVFRQGKTPRWWRSFSHDVWINSAKYTQELAEANRRSFERDAEEAAYAKANPPKKIPSTAIPETAIPEQNLNVTPEKSKTAMYIGIGAGVVGILGLALFLTRRK